VAIGLPALLYSAAIARYIGFRWLLRFSFFPALTALRHALGLLRACCVPAASLLFV
jgi:hypothetical protein